MGRQSTLLMKCLFFSRPNLLNAFLLVGISNFFSRIFYSVSVASNYYIAPQLLGSANQGSHFSVSTSHPGVTPVSVRPTLVPCSIYFFLPATPCTILPPILLSTSFLPLIRWNWYWLWTLGVLHWKSEGVAVFFFFFNRKYNRESSINFGVLSLNLNSDIW